MIKIIKLSLVAVLTTSAVFGDGDVGANDTVRKKITSVGAAEILHGDEASNFDELFTKGKVSGQLEVMYSGFNEGSSNNPTGADPYSTAIGGQLKFDTGHWNGFGAGAEFTTVHEIKPISGDNDKGERDVQTVSADGAYTELAQAYLEYINNGFTIRGGRQLIDTPLADSDDIRIVNNTFEAYTAMYEVDDITLMAGYLDRWQGTDAGLDNDEAWIDSGADDGTYFAGADYSGELFHVSAWYYDIAGEFGDQTGNKSVYIDATLHATKGDDLTLDISAQYLNQKEEDNSDIEADLYGTMLEVGISDLALMAAYNKRDADDDKTSFAGFGGGTLFTNMDNMITDAIIGGDVDVYVLGTSYTIDDVTIGYAYSRFKSDAINTGIFTRTKEDIVEHNIGAEYTASDNLTFFAIVTIDDDKENTGSNAINNSGDYTHVRISASYNF